MMNKYKILILCLILLLSNGCVKQSLTDKMMNYINNKYDDEFIYVGPYGGSAGSNQKKITVSSKKFPDKAIHVICNDIEGKQEMSDNYLGIKFEEQTYNEIEKRLKEIFNQEIYLEYNANVLASIDNPSDETTLEEYISDPNSVIVFNAIVCVDSNYDKIKIEESILNLFSDMAVIGFIHLVGDDFDFNNQDEWYVKKFFMNNLHYDTYSFQIESESTVTDSHWEKE